MPLAFEDFAVGQVLGGGTHTVSAEEIVAFATRFDPQPFHVDAEAAKSSIYGGLIASGWHTVSIAMRLACDAYIVDSLSGGSPGVDQIRWLKPVRPGDTLRAEFAVVAVRPSASKPDRGTVTTEWRMTNQRGEQVMRMQGIGIFLRRL